MCVGKCKCLFYVTCIITQPIKEKYKKDKWTVYSLFYPISALFSLQTQTLYKKKKQSEIEPRVPAFFFPLLQKLHWQFV